MKRRIVTPWSDAEIKGSLTDNIRTDVLKEIGRKSFRLTAALAAEHPIVQLLAVIPIGSSVRIFGPAIKPSIDMLMFKIILLIALLLFNVHQ